MTTKSAATIWPCATFCPAWSWPTLAKSAPLRQVLEARATLDDLEAVRLLDDQG